MTNALWLRVNYQGAMTSHTSKTWKRKILFWLEKIHSFSDVFINCWQLRIVISNKLDFKLSYTHTKEIISEQLKYDVFRRIAYLFLLGCINEINVGKKFIITWILKYFWGKDSFIYFNDVEIGIDAIVEMNTSYLCYCTTIFTICY